MIIRHISIENFRGIKNLDWHVNGWLLCLIGPGDSTKTTILDAVELALIPRWNVPFRDSDFYQADTSTQIRIQLTLGNLMDDLLSEDRCGLHPPEECKICTDERQYVGWQGQQWTTLDDLRQSHRNVVRLEELSVYGIGMEPSFAIGQRALFVTHPDGNILWDCIPLIDNGLVEMVEGIGGISAIAPLPPERSACVGFVAFDRRAL